MFFFFSFNFFSISQKRCPTLSSNPSGDGLRPHLTVVFTSGIITTTTIRTRTLISRTVNNRTTPPPPTRKRWKEGETMRITIVFFHSPKQAACRPIASHHSLSCFIASSGRLCRNFWFGSRPPRGTSQDMRRGGRVSHTNAALPVAAVGAHLYAHNGYAYWEMPRQPRPDKRASRAAGVWRSSVDIPVFLVRRGAFSGYSVRFASRNLGAEGRTSPGRIDVFALLQRRGPLRWWEDGNVCWNKRRKQTCKGNVFVLCASKKNVLWVAYKASLFKWHTSDSQESKEMLATYIYDSCAFICLYKHAS